MIITIAVRLAQLTVPLLAFGRQVPITVTDTLGEGESRGWTHMQDVGGYVSTVIGKWCLADIVVSKG